MDGNKPPGRIYLQWYDEAEELAMHEGVTWCVDQINESDVEYVLATGVAELGAVGQELYSALVEYEMDSEGEAPIKHRKMMCRARQALPTEEDAT